MSVKRVASKMPLKSLDELFGTDEGSESGVRDISLDNLHTFKNHPFRIKDDAEMDMLKVSIKEHGVLVPGIVRMRIEGGYELVSGHRRKRACELAGLSTMPVTIRELTDDEAIIVMVNSNIQREELLPSEKAFAYKMEYEALKRQGKRWDLTSDQVEQKSEETNAADILSMSLSISSAQIRRYISLASLLPELLNMTDEKKIPFNTAVAMSSMNIEAQKLLFEYIKNHEKMPLLKQVEEMKKLWKADVLTYQTIDRIMTGQQGTKFSVSIPSKAIKQYFPPEYSKEDIEKVITQLLEDWAKDHR